MNTDAPKGQVIFKHVVTIGTVSGYYDHAPLKITIVYGNELNPTRPYSLSITGWYGGNRNGGGGQCVDTLRNEITKYAPGWNAERANQLADVWERWHMNDTRAECEHQRELGWRELAKVPVTLYHWRLKMSVLDQQKKAEKRILEATKAGKRVKATKAEMKVIGLSWDKLTHYPELSAEDAKYYEPKRQLFSGDQGHTEVKTLGWLKPSEHPFGLLTAQCPVCGYKRGTSWLHEDVPQDVLDWLQSL
jgi:hypothetical protein